MKYKIDGWNNFCRVFELPEKFPNDYCFGGGHQVNFQMVDWFNPVAGLGVPAVPKEVWLKEVGPIETKEKTIEDLNNTIVPWLKDKRYVKEGKSYLILFNFGASLVFTK